MRDGESTPPPFFRQNAYALPLPLLSIAETYHNLLKQAEPFLTTSSQLEGESEGDCYQGVFGSESRGIFEFGDFGIRELFLLNKKWLVERRHEKV